MSRRLFGSRRPAARRRCTLMGRVGLLASRAAGKGANGIARQDVDEQGNTGAAIDSSLATGLDAGSVSTLLLHAP